MAGRGSCPLLFILLAVFLHAPLLTAAPYLKTASGGGQEQLPLDDLFRPSQGLIGPLFRHNDYSLDPPTEGGCYYQFRRYDEGDRIITNEPCLNCTCHNSMLMCYLKVCPFSKPIGQDCTVEKSPDQCCPVITCPQVPVNLQVMQMSPSSTTSSPTTAVVPFSEHGCSIDGVYYPDGAQVPGDPNNPCELCYCIRNHTACLMQECILKVEGCKPVFEHGTCCPIRYMCVHEKQIEEITTTTLAPNGSLITTTILPPTTSGCYHLGAFYADGASVPSSDPCEHCYCMNDDMVCAVQECRSPLDEENENCKPQAPPPGVCCPEAYDCPEVPVSTTLDYNLTTATVQEASTPKVEDDSEKAKTTTVTSLEDKESEEPVTSVPDDQETFVEDHLYTAKPEPASQEKEEEKQVTMVESDDLVTHYPSEEVTEPEYGLDSTGPEYIAPSTDFTLEDAEKETSAKTTTQKVLTESVTTSSIPTPDKEETLVDDYLTTGEPELTSAEIEEEKQVTMVESDDLETHDPTEEVKEPEEIVDFTQPEYVTPSIDYGLEDSEKETTSAKTTTQKVHAESVTTSSIPVEDMSKETTPKEAITEMLGDVPSSELDAHHQFATDTDDKTKPEDYITTHPITITQQTPVSPDLQHTQIIIDTIDFVTKKPDAILSSLETRTTSSENETVTTTEAMTDKIMVHLTTVSTMIEDKEDTKVVTKLPEIDEDAFDQQGQEHETIIDFLFTPEPETLPGLSLTHNVSQIGIANVTKTPEIPEDIFISTEAEKEIAIVFPTSKPVEIPFTKATTQKPYVTSTDVPMVVIDKDGTTETTHLEDEELEDIKIIELSTVKTMTDIELEQTTLGDKVQEEDTTPSDLDEEDKPDDKEITELITVKPAKVVTLVPELATTYLLPKYTTASEVVSIDMLTTDSPGDKDTVTEPDTPTFELPAEDKICILNGQTYFEGDSMPSVYPCEECVCKEGVVLCPHVVCSPPPPVVLGCEEQNITNECCPSYECPDIDTENMIVIPDEMLTEAQFTAPEEEEAPVPSASTSTEKPVTTDSIKPDKIEIDDTTTDSDQLDIKEMEHTTSYDILTTDEDYKTTIVPDTSTLQPIVPLPEKKPDEAEVEIPSVIEDSLFPSDIDATFGLEPSEEDATVKPATMLEETTLSPAEEMAEITEEPTSQEEAFTDDEVVDVDSTTERVEEDKPTSLPEELISDVTTEIVDVSTISAVTPEVPEITADIKPDTITTQPTDTDIESVSEEIDIVDSLEPQTTEPTEEMKELTTSMPEETPTDYAETDTDDSYKITTQSPPEKETEDSVPIDDLTTTPTIETKPIDETQPATSITEEEDIEVTTQASEKPSESTALVTEIPSEEKEPVTTEQPDMDEDTQTPEPVTTEQPYTDEGTQSPEPVVTEQPYPDEGTQSPEPVVTEQPYTDEDTKSPEPAVTEQPYTDEGTQSPEPVVTEQPYTDEDTKSPEPAVTEQPYTDEDTPSPEPIESSTGIPGEGNCNVNGTVYENESPVPVTNKCQQKCTCKNSQVTCLLAACPPAPPMFLRCSSTQKSEECCPTFECSDISTEAPPSTECIKEGVQYLEGDYVPSADLCTDCYCVGGKIVCATLECVKPHESCVAVRSANLTDPCCPNSYECPEHMFAMDLETDFGIDSEYFADTVTSKIPDSYETELETSTAMTEKTETSLPDELETTQPGPEQPETETESDVMKTETVTEETADFEPITEDKLTTQIPDEIPMEEETDDASLKEITDKTPIEETTYATPFESTEKSPVEETTDEIFAEIPVTETPAKETTTVTFTDETTEAVPDEETTYETPVEETTVAVVDEKATDKIPVEETTFKIPVEETTYKIPVEETTYKIPVEETTYKIPVEETTYIIPVEETTYKMPVEETTYKIPVEEVEETTYIIPVEKTTYKIPVEETTYKIPVEKTTYKIPVEETTYKIPVEETTYKIPVEETTYKIPVEETTEEISDEKTVDTTDETLLEKTTVYTPVKETTIGTHVDETTDKITAEEVTDKTTVVPIIDTTIVEETTFAETTEDTVTEMSIKSTPMVPIVKPAILEGCWWFDNNVYNHGDDVPANNKCQENCKCKNGTVICERMACPPIPPTFFRCDSVASTDSCCPIYNCAPDPAGKVCFHQGKTYYHEEHVPSPTLCTDCWCLDGAVKCATIECGFPKDNCTAVQQIENECCPVRYVCSEEADTSVSHEFAIPIDETPEIESMVTASPKPEKPATEGITPTEVSVTIHELSSTTKPPTTETIAEEPEEDTDAKEDVIPTQMNVTSYEQSSTSKPSTPETIAEEPEKDTESEEVQFPISFPSEGDVGPTYLLPSSVNETTTWKPSTTTELVLGPGSCLFDGKVYVSAKQIPRDDPCDFCFCFRGDIICLQQTCPPPIPGCYEEAIPGFCCPRYECPVTQAVINVTTTTPSPFPGFPPSQKTKRISVCEIEGVHYASGEIVASASSPCHECRCGGDGFMKCNPLECESGRKLHKFGYR